MMIYGHCYNYKVTLVHGISKNQLLTGGHHLVEDWGWTFQLNR